MLPHVFLSWDNRKTLIAFLSLLVLIVGIYSVCGWSETVKRLLGLQKEAIPTQPFCKEEFLRYAQRSKSLQHVFESVRTSPSDDLADRMAYMIDDLVPPYDWNWHRLSPSIHCSYAELIGMLGRTYPQLSERALDLCALQYTQRFSARILANIQGVEPVLVKLLRKSIKSKLKAANNTSKDVRRMVKAYLKDGVLLQ